MLPPVALSDPKKRYSFKIIGKELVTHDTYKYLIELPDPSLRLGAKSGQHIYIIGVVNNEEVYHKYTPINLEEKTGSFNLVIKIYRPNEKFPNGGRLTQYIESLNIGDSINVEGPFGRCVYLHNGNLSLQIEKNSPRFDKHVKLLGMVAGGSGIAPFLQIINTVCNDPNDNTVISLIFANHVRSF
jgi:cytochrome-b5 reductase